MDTSAPSAALRDTLPLPLMAGIAALPPLAIDMYLPALPQIAGDFGADLSVIQNSLSIFLVGFGSGLLLFGPLSDRFGRRPLALFGLMGFALASLCLTLSTNATLFILFRLLQGFLGSAATVTIPAMIRDCYGKDAAKGMSSMMMIMLIAPLLAPLLGSLALQLGPWEGVFGSLTVYALTLLGLAWWKLPETWVRSGQARSILGNYKLILGTRGIHIDLVSFMLASLAFFTYLTAVSFVYITYYGTSEILFGILFACSASALITANFINSRVVSRVGPRRMLHYGQASAVSCALALVIFTWLEWGLWPTVVAFVGMVGSLGICAVNADALVLIQFPHQASSASAVTGTLRFGFGALAGPILHWAYDGTPLHVGLVLLTVLGVSAGLQIIRSIIYAPERSANA
jgi:DHA1 family bicyclomycin/chloramphenicol resistance-like MFS transporter